LLVYSVVLWEDDTAEQASANYEKREIGFTSRFLDNGTVEGMNMMSEHEVTHLAVRIRGYKTDSLRMIFDRLKLATNMFPSFMLFINESNYFNLPGDSLSGHSGASLDEFLTSFIHSVLNINRLRENIGREYVRNYARIERRALDPQRPDELELVDAQQREILTPQIRLNILDNYLLVLNELIGIERTRGASPSLVLSNFLTARLEIESVRRDVLSNQ